MKLRHFLMIVFFVKVTFSLNPDLIPNNIKPINIDAFTTFLLLLLQAASITSKFKKLFNI